MQWKRPFAGYNFVLFDRKRSLPAVEKKTVSGEAQHIGDYGLYQTDR